MSIGENKLVIGIILGALLGIFCGWSFGESMLSLSWLGDLFLDAEIEEILSIDINGYSYTQ